MPTTDVVRKYRIADTKREPDRFVVTADFIEVTDGEETKVGSINHAFPLEMTEDDINAEVTKACQVFFQDRERAKANAVKDKIDADAEVTKSNLINKEQTI